MQRPNLKNSLTPRLSKMDKYHFIPYGGTDNQAADVDHAEIVVLPLCYERGASYGTGSEKGPFYLLDASTQLDCLDGESLIDWSKIRIHTLQPLFPASDPQQAVKQMQQAAENVISHNKFLLSIGGDHTVSLGPIMAAANVHPDMGVLQIDWVYYKLMLILISEMNGMEVSTTMPVLCAGYLKH
jgi:agmatinase